MTQTKLSQKIYMTQFSGNNYRKCIVISNLVLFWLKYNKMCKFMMVHLSAS